MSINANVERAKSDYDRAYEAGKQAEREAYWNAITANGKRTVYTGAFQRTRFTKDTMLPTYDIKPTVADNMFLYSAVEKSEMFSMTEVEKRSGKVFDFSDCTNFSGTFNSGCFNELNVIDLSKATSTYQTFYCGSSPADIERINRLIFSENTVISWGIFGYADNLEYVGFEGTIAANGIDLHWSTKLSKESIVLLINTLSTTTTELKVTLS